MEIREPRFQKGQKVMYEGNLYIVVEISSYSFSYNEYLYRIEDDVKQCVKSEEELEPYVEEHKSEKKNNKHYVYNYTCPNCNTILSEVENCNYCPECGTRLDWSKNEWGEWQWRLI